MSNHNVLAIANEFIRRGKADGKDVSNMQLQKLPYIAHGWSTVVLEAPLIRESPKVWPFRPVFEDLYRAGKRHGNGVVENYLHKNEASPFPDKRGAVAWEMMSTDENDLIDHVWVAYGSLDGRELSCLTAAIGSPWFCTISAKGAYAAIGNETIREHYETFKARNLCAL